MIILYLLWLLINSINSSTKEEEGMATLVAASSMVANSCSNPNQNWFTDTGAFDHITLDLSQFSIHQQSTAGETVTMGNGQE